MGKLQGKTAVITGGSTGIGFATAKLFVSEGAHVFITGRRQKPLDDAVKAIGHNVSGICGDVSNLDDLDRLYETVAARGRIDIVFANAGGGSIRLLENVTEDHFDETFDVNVKGAFFTVQKALPLLNDGASIILTGSEQSIKGTPGVSVYGASKAALRQLVRSWAVELTARRIRSNVISPGPTETPILDSLPRDVVSHLVDTIPIGRIGQAHEIAQAALFLASDEASFVTGTELFVDGGRAQV